MYVSSAKHLAPIVCHGAWFVTVPVTGILPERYVSAHGVKKSHLIETAVLRHLCASDAIPTDLEVPRVILVSRTAGKLILDRFETPKPPTPTMRVLHEG